MRLRRIELKLKETNHITESRRWRLGFGITPPTFRKRLLWEDELRCVLRFFLTKETQTRTNLAPLTKLRTYPRLSNTVSLRQHVRAGFRCARAQVQNTPL